MSNMRFGVVGLALCAAMTAAVPLGAQPALDPHSAQVDSIFAAFAGGESPGCAVAVVEGGATVLARGYGLASIEHGVPITPRTAFYAASVSKQFVALSADRFRPAAGAGEVAFGAGPDGGPRLEERGGGGATTVYVRIPDPVMTQEALAGLAGEYYSGELDTTWWVVASDAGLVVRRRARPDQPLEPAFADAFVLPAGVLRFDRDAEDRVTGFLIGAGRVTGFRFERRGGR